MFWLTTPVGRVPLRPRYGLPAYQVLLSLKKTSRKLGDGTGSGLVDGSQLSWSSQRSRKSRVWPDAMVSPKCSTGAGSRRPSWAIWVVWLPCGWNGWFSAPTLIMRTRAGAVVGLVGWLRTSAPYGWLGSSDEPLSWMVSGNSRPLTAKYRSRRAFTSY